MPVARPDLGISRVIAHLDLDCFYMQGDLFVLVLNALVKLLELMLRLGLRFGFVPVKDLDCCSSCGLLLFTIDDVNNTLSLRNIEGNFILWKCFKVIIKPCPFSLFACGLEKSNLVLS
jgi:hypothetical protein